MDLARLITALSQRRAQQQSQAFSPYARLARAMSAKGRDVRFPGPTERAQHASSGYAGSYGGIPNESAGGFQGDGFDNGGFQT